MNRCDVCQKEGILNIQPHPLQPIKTTECWDILGMDLFGPWPETTSGNKYVCVLTDLFSKFVIAQPIPNKEASSVAKVVTFVATTYGPPKKLLQIKVENFVYIYNI